MAKWCGPDLYSIAVISLALFLAAIFNIIHVVVLYRTLSSTEQLLRIQSLILLNISISSLIACSVINPLVFTSHFLAEENRNCDLTKKFTAIFWLAPQSCNFIGCMVLTLYRYVTCMFPLSCETIISRSRAITSIIIMYAFSYIPISLGTLLDNHTISGSVVYPLFKYSGIMFALFYFCNLVFLAIVNFHMWLLGYIAYRKDRDTTSSVLDSEEVNYAVLRRNHLKVAFISFVLPVKNILLFLPPIAIEFLIATGFTSPSLTLSQLIWGPIPAISHILDPLICIFLVKGTKQYLLQSIMPLINPILGVLRILFRTPNTRSINSVLPVEQ